MADRGVFRVSRAWGPVVVHPMIPREVKAAWSEYHEPIPLPTLDRCETRLPAIVCSCGVYLIEVGD